MATSGNFHFTLEHTEYNTYNTLLCYCKAELSKQRFNIEINFKIILNTVFNFIVLEVKLHVEIKLKIKLCICYLRFLKFY